MSAHPVWHCANCNADCVGAGYSHPGVAGALCYVCERDGGSGRSLWRSGANSPNVITYHADGFREDACGHPKEATATPPVHVFPARPVPGKPAWRLLPMEAMSDVLGVLSMGAAKYGPQDWRGRPDIVAESWEAAMRHLSKLALGEELDSESGLHHAAHVAVRMLFILAKHKEKP